MVMQKKIGSIKAGLAVMLAVMLAAPSVMGANAAETSERVENLRSELQSLELGDESSIALEEMREAESLLVKAEQAMSQRDVEGAKKKVRRAEYTVDLIQALVRVGNIEMSLQRQDRMYEEALEEIRELEEEIEELEERKASRERELRRIRGDQ